MFFINRNLKTQLIFSHYDMDKLHSDDQILSKLKQKVQGRCLHDYGYIIQVIKLDNSKESFHISVPKVQSNGCIIVVTFSAITFKPQKDDVIDIIAYQIKQQYIKGHADVMIPRSNMPGGCQYRQNENVYIFKDESTNQQIMIDKDSKVRCKCFQIKIDLNYQMKIFAKVEDRFIPTMQAN